MRKHEKLTKKQVWEHIKSTGIDLTRMKKNMAIVLRKKGLSFEKIGKELGVSWNTVRDWLKDEPFEKERVKRPNFTFEERERLIKKAIELRKKGLTFKEIGKELGVNGTTVRDWLKDEPFEKNRVKIKMPNFTFEEKERLIKKAIELRLKGLTFKEIGRELGVTGAAVKYWLKDEPFEIERKEKYGKDSRSIAKELRLHKLSFSEIGKELGVTKATVRDWLKDEPFEKERVKKKRPNFTFEEKERLIKKAIELRLHGFKLSEIGKELGVHEHTVSRWLKDEPFEKERVKRKMPNFTFEERERLIKKAIELRLKGLTFKKIGKELGVHEETVRDWLKDDPDEIERREKYGKDSRSIAKELRLHGFKFSEIGKELGVTGEAVKYWLKDEPFEKNRVKRKMPNFTFEEKERLIKKAIELRIKGLTFKKIGKELGVTGATVRDWLKDEKLHNNLESIFYLFF